MWYADPGISTFDLENVDANGRACDAKKLVKGRGEVSSNCKGIDWGDDGSTNGREKRGTKQGKMEIGVG